MFSTILLPLDGSDLSERAVPHAVDLARRYGADLLLLRATALPDRVYAPPDFSGAQLEKFRDAERNSITGYLRQWQERLEKEGVPCRTLCRLDDAARAIVEEAEAADVDLIVMSSHGRGGFDRWVHGSVAEKVLRSAPCPLLLIRVPPNAPTPNLLLSRPEAAPQ